MKCACPGENLKAADHAERLVRQPGTVMIDGSGTDAAVAAHFPVRAKGDHKHINIM